MSKTRVYQIWEGMKQRCLNPNNSAYEYYGGRGLGIYEDWHTFEGFYADVLDPPPGMSLDRTDNDADYAPWNWRWAPRSVQLANRRPYRRRRSKAGRK
jgi:hypothetical protein